VAKMMGRRYIGIDINRRYIKMAQDRVRQAPGFQPLLLVGRAKYPGKEELQQMFENEAGSAGKNAEVKHKRKTYGRNVPVKEDKQLTLV
jgi:modification methylase